MKKPVLITCQPDDSFFIWQNHAYIESCLENGFTEDQIHILLYCPKDREPNPKWDKLKETYPKLGIHRYSDRGVNNFLPIYIPILRPHLMWQHFEKFPELEKETIIYTDCDILWTKKPDIEKFLEDDVNYMSDAHSYMNYDYLVNKQQYVTKNKTIAEKRDFLKEICDIVGISKDIVKENNDNIGGVQYILKNLNSDFWKKVERDCLSIRTGMMSINRAFFDHESKGYQSWAADLWAVIFNLWHFNREVKIVPELGFTWSTDSADKWDTKPIFHNAGIVADVMTNKPVFYKGKYNQEHLNPFDDPHFYKVTEEEPLLCNHLYARKLLQLKNKYKLWQVTDKI